MSTILAIHTWNAYSSLVIGTLLNALLIHVAHRHSRGDLKEYRWAYYYLCALNILLLFLHTTIQPVHIVTNEPISFMAINGPTAGISSESNIVQYVMIILYLTCLNNIIISLAIQFLDRYLLVCRKFNNPLKRYAISAILNVLLLAIMLTSNLMYFAETDVDAEQLPSLGEFMTTEDIERIEIACEFDQSDPVKKAASNVLIGTMLLCYFIILFCFFQIRAFLKTHLPASGFNMTINVKLVKEVTMNLCIQAILPLFCQTNIILSILLRLAETHSNLLAHYEMLSTLPHSWVPLLNPLITLLTIKEYRSAVCAVFMQIRSQLGRSSTVHTQNTKNTSKM